MKKPAINNLNSKKRELLSDYPEMAPLIDSSPAQLLLEESLRFRKISAPHWDVLLDALEPDPIRQEPGIALWYKRRNLTLVLLLEWKGAFYQGCIENCTGSASIHNGFVQLDGGAWR